MSNDCYLFSYFKGNGEDGLYLAASSDGREWTQVGGRPFLAPTIGGKLMRDPCLCLGPDGVFHLAWTTGWWDTGIGIAHSRDLIHWSEQTYLPVMAHEPEAHNAWAPEIFYDPETARYLIHWASTVCNQFTETEDSGDMHEDLKCNHRTYYITTEDFVSYSPVAVLYDGGFNAIDTNIAFDGTRYLLFVKDETKRPEPAKNIRLATAASVTGPYSPASPPISPDWVEGPTALRVGDEWIVYYDEYAARRYGAIASKDLKTWRVISNEVKFPAGASHGTALRVDRAIVEALVNW
ncbi:MAG TPA: glycoside hydrolase family 43 protein [Capsulimonadaceae bacterium]|jgi:beta-xylosidase